MSMSLLPWLHMKPPTTDSQILIAIHSPNSLILCTGHGDDVIGTYELKLWDISTKQLLHTLKHMANVLSAAFSLTGNQLCSGGWDNTIYVWNVATGACVRTWVAHDERIFSVAYSACATMIASASGTLLCHKIHQCPEAALYPYPAFPLGTP